MIKNIFSEDLSGRGIGAGGNERLVRRLFMGPRKDLHECLLNEEQ